MEHETSGLRDILYVAGATAAHGRPFWPGGVVVQEDDEMPPFFRKDSEVGIALETDCEVGEVLDSLVSDYDNGLLSAYGSPTFTAFFKSESYDKSPPWEISAECNPDFAKELHQFNEDRRQGKFKLNSFRFGNQSEDGYSTIFNAFGSICSLYITQRTTEGELSSFVHGYISSPVLGVYPYHQECSEEVPIAELPRIIKRI